MLPRARAQWQAWAVLLELLVQVRQWPPVQLPALALPQQQQLVLELLLLQVQ